MRSLMAAVGIFTAVAVALAWGPDQGEVVVLLTRSGESELETPLWIVSVDGRDYLRALHRDAQWLDRVRAEGNVTLRRGGQGAGGSRIAIPVDDPAIRARVNEAMAQKYGKLERLWSWLGDADESVPVLLAPAEREWVGPEPSS